MTTTNDTSRAQTLLDAAIAGALEVLQDREAPATSRASAVGSAIRLFELLRGDDPGADKDASELTPEELEARIRKLQKEREQVEQD